MAFDSIHSVFDRLDEWRNLPGYALERRADIFFSFFLVEILSLKFCIGEDSVVVPEFPLKKDKSNQSRKVDFFVIAGDRQRSFLVELKTDKRSLSVSQLKYLDESRNQKLGTLIEDVKTLAINAKKTQRFKYLHLLNMLADLDLVYLGERLRIDSFDPPKYICKYMREEIRARSIDCKPQAVYIVPEIPDEADFYQDFVWISFDAVTETIGNKGTFCKRFAKSLLSWLELDAGYIEAVLSAQTHH